MGVYKIQSSRATTHAALKSIIKYVLNPDKTPSCAYGVTGHFDKEITASNVYNNFLENKRFWNQDNGRMYRHITLGFSPSDNLSPQEALDFGIEFCEKAYPGHIAVVSVHEDTDNIHVHCVIDYVSYINGKRISCRREDLYMRRAINDQMCRERGLYIPQKGHHYDGTAIGPDEVIAWNKQKYYAMKNQKRKSEIARLGDDIINALLYSQNFFEFIYRLHKAFWKLLWSPDKSNLTFVSKETGRKFGSTNLQKNHGEKFRSVFGEEFVLDRKHVETLLDLPVDLRKNYFRKFKEIFIDFENDPNYKDIPAWKPPQIHPTRKHTRDYSLDRN